MIRGGEQVILDAGFDWSLWTICDTVFDTHEYDLVNDAYRYYADCAQQIEAFFNDEACGLEEHDEIYHVVHGGHVDWMVIAKEYAWDRWSDEVKRHINSQPTHNTLCDGLTQTERVEG